MRWTFAALVTLLMLVPSATAFAGATDTGTVSEAQDACAAPPCGEINPRIMFNFPDLGAETVAMETGETRTFQGQVTYWADTDDEGYAPGNPQEPIFIRFSFPRLPDWAKMSVEPTEIEVPINTCAECVKTGDGSPPAVSWEYSDGINVTVEAVDTPQKTPGYDYAKLQLFAKSTETTIYNPGYGIREVRVVPGSTDAETTSEDANNTPGASILAAMSVLGTVAALSAARRW